ncbi:MAG: S-layer homology domain-containing protein, partial [Bacillota bacterium]|nr:S-layer homology domain-containing protein [Bacillota bacterium]
MKYQFRKKHSAALLLALMMACSPITAQAASFADMADVPWPGAEVPINKAADLGLVVGETINGKSYFKPKDPVSMSQACQLAYKLLLETGKATADASLVTKWATTMNTYKIQSWAHPAVSYCLEKIIVSIGDLSGFVSGEINVSATREQAAEIFGRMLIVGIPGSNAGSTATKFADNASISADVIPYIALLNEKGIINGDTDNKFNPKNKLNRTETAVMVT